jgi:hypothetical protein
MVIDIVSIEREGPGAYRVKLLDELRNTGTYRFDVETCRNFDSFFLKVKEVWVERVTSSGLHISGGANQQMLRTSHEKWAAFFADEAENAKDKRPLKKHK